MDRALKERITGAVVLVTIIILIVPVFLDGTANDIETVTETVLLPGQDEQRRKQQTIVLERDRDQPVPATPEREAPVASTGKETPRDLAPAAAPPPSDVVSARSEPEPAAANEQPAATQVPVQEAPEPVQEKEPRRVAQAEVEPSASSDSTTGMWAVQLGSFSNPDNAERLAGELRADGYAAFLSQLKRSDGAALHRVRIGPQKDRDGAEAVARRLSGNGHEGQVVPHP